jgi:glycosyltransferase involved in cell wall biosynthesis
MLKNIVVLNDNARVTGGADKIALDSAVGLARRGYHVDLLTATTPIAPELLSVPRLAVHSTDQFEILQDPSRLRAATQGLWNVKSYRAASTLLDDLRAEETVVHLHLWAKALSSSVVRAAVDRGFRVVCTLHDYMLSCPVGTWFDHGAQRICTRVPLSASCLMAHCDSRSYADKLWRTARTLVQSTAGKLPSGLTDVIAISDMVISKLRPYLPPEIRVHRLSNFADVVRQERVDAAANSSFVFSGRLAKEKGPVTFAQAAHAAGVSALFLGEGECRTAVREAMPQALISGWLRHEQSLQQLRRARSLVFPSLWYEAQPLIILEALALGIPCVVSETSAARDMIIPERTGLLFRTGDVADLQDKLARLRDDDELVGRLSRNAYEDYWKSPCTLESHLDGLIDIYQTMLAGQPQEVLAQV